MAERVPGLVLATQSGFYDVLLDDGRQLRCVLRGRLKKEKRYTTDLVVVGDRVLVTPVGEREGAIEEVLPRKNALTRRAPHRFKRFYQAVAANLDQLVVVLAAAQPDPSPGLVDRYLVLAEAKEIPPLLVCNKVDLTGEAKARERFAEFEAIGYPVLYTSAVTGQGVEALREALTGKFSAVVGPSGVGKSSLLNAVQPGLELAVAPVSKTGKGRHTTRHARLIPLEGGGYVADTPGIRELGLHDVEPEGFDRYFVEFEPYRRRCAFADCTHREEPGCAVREAVDEGKISERRYRSYLKLLEEAEDLARFWER